MTYQNTLNLISRHTKTVPNYSCGVRKNLIAAIGGLDSEISLHMATILGLYKFPQVTYSLFSPALSEKTQLTSLYQMVPREEHQYDGIVKLLSYFQWKWIGIIIMEDDKGELFAQTLTRLLVLSGICTAFIQRTSAHRDLLDFLGMIENFRNISMMLSTVNVDVFLVNADTHTMLDVQWLLLAAEMFGVAALNKVWVMTAHWDFSSETFHRYLDTCIFHGALSFSVQSKAVEGFQNFLRDLDPYSEVDGFIRIFWEQAFDCSSRDAEMVDENADNICTGEENLESLPGTFFEMQMTSQSYSIYNAVCAVAHAFHAMNSARTKHRATVHGQFLSAQLQPFQLLAFLKTITFNNTAGDQVLFNENGELQAGFDIINWVIFPNKSFSRVKVGSMDPQAPQGKQFSINEKTIEWPQGFNHVMPFALCNDPCDPGTSKQKKEEEPFCCYDCVPCPEGKMTNETDMNDCFECPEGNYPNNGKTHCLRKYLNFLSYGEPLGMSVALPAFGLSATTALVLGVFIKHRNTPIVKANNQTLTYTLLISLLLCFLCSFLFIGQPKMLSCYLRQTAFGIIFSVAISSVLAKTILVILAFMATKPGTQIRKWVGKRLAYSIVFCCTFIQASICVIWLYIDAPFPQLDKHSLPEEILVKCNEGKANMFYYVLGYMAFLALLSFIVAFFARKLPDTFNEAKFITFSMLVFCSVVWLSFVPTYLSTKGKYMVAVEIFSILASSTGLLGCIFSPKCYIILLTPELNSREHLVRRKLSDV
uniref:Vomeronasal type-2 receptor 26-like n=1 Tax=Pogona vitticeps TaxID=103695 RepID=A0ABM5GQ77_9SAUR